MPSVVRSGISGSTALIRKRDLARLVLDTEFILANYLLIYDEGIILCSEGKTLISIRIIKAILTEERNWTERLSGR